VGVDVRAIRGRAVLLDIIASADVFLTNFRPAALRRLGLDVDELRERNPKLIYARGTGYGVRGPDAERAGYDGSSYWARGGVGWSLTTPDAITPARQRPAMGDNPAGVNLAFGVVAALFKRERTGSPSVVDASLLAHAMWSMASDIVSATNPGWAGRGAARQEGWNPLTEPYRTRDGEWIVLNVLEPDRYWSDICGHLGALDLEEDPRFTTAAMRSENADACVAALAAKFSERDLDEWRLILATTDAPWEALQSAAGLHDDPQVEANGYLMAIPGLGPADRVVSPPIQFDEAPLAPKRAPELGQDTEAVLLELGYDWDTLTDLKSSGIIT
jgi:crotonobetainyl-CoA:carnitine CoA-transferase CaiB-like acyl-CoA transferase